MTEQRYKAVLVVVGEDYDRRARRFRPGGGAKTRRPGRFVDMVRHRMQLVAERGKYRDAIAWIGEMNASLRRLGLPEWTAWAPLAGEFNHLVLEADYENLAAFDAAQEKFQNDTPNMNLFRKGNEWGSRSHWPKDEVLQSAPTIA